MCPGACPRKTSAWTQFGNTEEFCKPQANKVRAHFDLLTSFRQSTINIDERYNTVQAQTNLAKYPLETVKILHRDIFWFFLKDEEFVSKTINERSVDLDKFPASKVCCLPRRWKAPRPQQDTSNRWMVISKWPRST